MKPPKKTRSTHERSAQRYAAKLLFQYVTEDSKRGGYYLVEERIIVVEAISAKESYETVMARAMDAAFSYMADDGGRVSFEFLGCRELIHLGAECEADEVWYSTGKMLDPRARLEKLVPRPELLSAFANEERH